MTTEIEKQFFNTFGIEPKYYCGNHFVFEAMLEYECTEGNREKCKTCKDVRKSYPQITDHLLLELICELSDVCCPYFAFKRSISELKETVLKLCMAYKDLLKQQVRALFEEVKNDR